VAEHCLFGAAGSGQSGEKVRFGWDDDAGDCPARAELALAQGKPVYGRHARHVFSGSKHVLASCWHRRNTRRRDARK